MNRTAAVEVLDLAMPPGWADVEVSVLESAEDFLGAAARELNVEALVSLLSDPELSIAKTATLFLPLFDDGGSVIGILIAAMLAVAIPAAACPSPDSPAFTPEIRDGVSVPGGSTASFFTLTLPVVSPDNDVAVLLTFSSPNTPLADFLEAGFRSIASSATLNSRPLE